MGCCDRRTCKKCNFKCKFNPKGCVKKCKCRMEHEQKILEQKQTEVRASVRKSQYGSVRGTQSLSGEDHADSMMLDTTNAIFNPGKPEKGGS